MSKVLWYLLIARAHYLRTMKIDYDWLAVDTCGWEARKLMVKFLRYH